MKYVAFVTDGAIDLRSFSTFGFNSKPNTTSPIGFFGTGLKISTAVIARLGCKMIVMIDGIEHEFYTSPTEFRGKSFDLVRMKKRKSLMSRWQYQEMPYTTELGKNWEPWQVFRELESNTRDENGHTYLLDDETPVGMSFLNDQWRGKTVILIDEPSIVSCYERMNDIFLNPDIDLRVANDKCQVFNVSSKYLFYRGMRVLELPKPSAFTYNILSEQRLTEDRTLYSWSAMWEIRDLIMQSTDNDFIETVVQLDEDKFWEGKIEFDDVYAPAGATFRGVVGARKARGLPLLSRVGSYYDRYNAPADTDPNVTVTYRRSQWQAIAEVLAEGGDFEELRQRLTWDEQDIRWQIFLGFRDSQTKELEKNRVLEDGDPF